MVSSMTTLAELMQERTPSAASAAPSHNDAHPLGVLGDSVRFGRGCPEILQDHFSQKRNIECPYFWTLTLPSAAT